MIVHSLKCHLLKISTWSRGRMVAGVRESWFGDLWLMCCCYFASFMTTSLCWYFGWLLLFSSISVFSLVSHVWWWHVDRGVYTIFLCFVKKIKGGLLEPRSTSNVCSMTWSVIDLISQDMRQPRHIYMLVFLTWALLDVVLISRWASWMFLTLSLKLES